MNVYQLNNFVMFYFSRPMLSVKSLSPFSPLLLTAAFALPMLPNPVIAQSLLETPWLESRPLLLAQIGHPRPTDRAQFFEQLNVTPEQRQRLRQIRQKYQGQMSAIQPDLAAAQRELIKMMTGNSSNDAIRLKHNEVAQLRQQVGNLRFESMLEMRQVLTPQQRQQFVQLIQQRRQRFGRRHP